MKNNTKLFRHSTVACAIGLLFLNTAWADFTNYYALPGFPIPFTATTSGTYSNWTFDLSFPPGHAQMAVSANGTSAVFSELGLAGDYDVFTTTIPYDGTFQFSWQGTFDGLTECGFWSNDIPAVTIVPDYTSGPAQGTFSSPVKAGDVVGWYMVQEDDDIRVDWQITDFGAPQPSGPPRITSQPANQGAVAGGTASFNVTATGAEPMSYQWFKDGALLTGATGGTYMIAGVTLTNLGTYFVLVTNIYGFACSSNALLTVLTPLHNFTISTNDARTPMEGLVLSGGALYGITYVGGIYGNGAVYKINTDGSGFALLHSFTATAQFTGINSDGANPFGSWNLLLAGDTLYGTAEAGGTNASGTVFKVSTNGTGFAVLHTFEYPTGTPPTNRDGSHPQSGLVLAGNTLYGTASDAGRGGNGTVFKVNTDGSGFAVLKHFSALSSSTNADGANPKASLLLNGGTLFGTANKGGAANRGTVFKINTNGDEFAVLKHFLYFDPDGWHPAASLVLNSNTLYGTATDGGSLGGGTIFKVDTDGSNFAVLHDFLGGDADGQYPEAGLTLNGGTLYGTTFDGGHSDYGTVFRLNTDGSGFSLLYNFTTTFSTNADGITPQAGVVLDGNTLYGTAESGGLKGFGTIFSLQFPTNATIAQPAIQAVTLVNGTIAFTWNSVPGQTYQVEYSTTLGSATWSSLGNPITATNNITSASDSVEADRQCFYRVKAGP